MRAVGNLGYNEDNIPVLVGEGAVQAIVNGMREHWKNEEVLSFAMTVLENLSSENGPCEEAPNSIGQDNHPARSGEDTLQIIAQEGAIQVILDAMRHYELNGQVSTGNVQ